MIRRASLYHSNSSPHLPLFHTLKDWKKESDSCSQWGEINIKPNIWVPANSQMSDHPRGRSNTVHTLILSLDKIKESWKFLRLQKRQGEMLNCVVW